MVSNFTGMPVQPNKAIVGKNALLMNQEFIKMDSLKKEQLMKLWMLKV